MYGDSLTFQSASQISFVAQLEGFAVAVRSGPGTAVCDWLSQMGNDAAAPVPPKVVVVAFSGNNMTSCMADANGDPLSGQPLLDKYAADLAAVRAIWEPLGVPVSVVGSPAIIVDDRVTFDAMLQGVVANYPDWSYEDPNPDISPNNVYTETMPCAPYESKPGVNCNGPVIDGVATNIVRQTDGVHFCPGAAPNEMSCSVYSSGSLRWAVHISNAAFKSFAKAGTSPTGVYVPAS